PLRRPVVGADGAHRGRLRRGARAPERLPPRRHGGRGRRRPSHGQGAERGGPRLAATGKPSWAGGRAGGDRRGGLYDLGGRRLDRRGARERQLGAATEPGVSPGDRATTLSYDPSTLAVLIARLTGVAEEMQAVLRRAASSPNIKERA